VRSSGLDTFTSEDGAAWTVFLKDLVERGLAGVQLVISDDHKGLLSALETLLPGTSWQRCRTHFMRNLLCRVPKSAQPFMATMVRTIFAQPSAAEVAAQLRRVVCQLQHRFPEVAAMLADAEPEITAFAAFPVEHWTQIWSNNLDGRGRHVAKIRHSRRIPRAGVDATACRSSLDREYRT